MIQGHRWKRAGDLGKVRKGWCWLPRLCQEFSACAGMGWVNGDYLALERRRKDDERGCKRKAQVVSKIIEACKEGGRNCSENHSRSSKVYNSAENLSRSPEPTFRLLGEDLWAKIPQHKGMNPWTPERLSSCPTYSHFFNRFHHLS